MPTVAVDDDSNQNRDEQGVVNAPQRTDLARPQQTITRPKPKDEAFLFRIWIKQYQPRDVRPMDITSFLDEFLGGENYEIDFARGMLLVFERELANKLKNEYVTILPNNFYFQGIKPYLAPGFVEQRYLDPSWSRFFKRGTREIPEKILQPPKEGLVPLSVFLIPWRRRT
eukprot:TRINITY_DN4668_c0_g2_i4.p1 TRINITY_DN4668_c0_g2~~TRINITY_DN4668_c0_g2_i4.p1  ORF type:complete len:170 (+),score=13.49 TRINITY_DN4668_c0_g2_i4:604-1113(+)